jgi:putative ATPase
LGHGKGYIYPHDDPAGVVQQQYAPDGLAGKRYYLPSTHGAEARVSERSERIRSVLAGGMPIDERPRAGEPATGRQAAESEAPAAGPRSAESEAPAGGPQSTESEASAAGPESAESGEPAAGPQSVES